MTTSDTLKAKNRRKRKKKKGNNKELNVKELDQKVTELIDILKDNDQYIPNGPTMKDLEQMDNGNFHNSKQRKGHGTGNTKQNKKQMKKNHKLLLKLWLKQLQDAVDKIQSDTNIESYDIDILDMDLFEQE